MSGKDECPGVACRYEIDNICWESELSEFKLKTWLAADAFDLTSKRGQNWLAWFQVSVSEGGWAAASNFQELFCRSLIIRLFILCPAGKKRIGIDRPLLWHFRELPL
jgi:hypothetical protein